jgi:lysophospholipase L1-like esterase
MPSVGGRSRRRRIRRWPTTAAAALVAAAAAITAVSAGGTATVASARLASASNAGGNPAAGTAKAQVAGPQRATVRHAAMSSSASASGDLSTVLSQTVHGGYTAAGIGMRNLGYGTISVTGVPAGATVKSATLVWDILADAAGPSFAQGTLDGKAFTGTQWASGASPCWPVSANFSYEADVTGLVTGNGSYKLAGFATGQSDGADPWTSGSTAPLDEGATLVVVYQLASMPEVTVQIAEGATETELGNTASATLAGFTVGATPSATTTYIVADGQLPGNTASFDGTTLPGVGFSGNDPQAVPHYSQGNLWDTVTADVSADLHQGDTSATIGVTGNDDCLVWVGQVLAVKTGAVLAFGDSVAAGYGLGPSQGYPDNPDAYSAVLAQKLGYGDGNYAVEGRCAAADLGCSDPSDPVDWQIQQVPANYQPNLITLTVGANDINFRGCLIDIIVFGDALLKSNTDPCSASNLTRDLNAFKPALKADLTKLKSKYPGVPIMVMDYYNPFPPAPAANHPACSFNLLPTLTYLHTQGAWLGVVYTALFQKSTFASDERMVQGRLYQDAKSVLGQLNSAINATASGLATVVNTNDFTGHDICSTDSWVFSPTFQVGMSLKIAAVSLSLQTSWGDNEVCPDPVDPLDLNLHFNPSVQFSNKYLQLSGSFKLAVGANCLPHPKATGQAAIAGDFLNQGA